MDLDADRLVVAVESRISVEPWPDMVSLRRNQSVTMMLVLHVISSNANFVSDECRCRMHE